MEDATKADAVSRNRNESQQKPPSEVKRKYQPKGIEKFSPNELMLLFILVFLCSEGSGILLESYLESQGKPGGLLIHLVEIFLFLMATFLIVYLPLKRRLADKEKTVEAMRESEQHLRLALEGTNSGLWDWDLSTSMAYYSPSGEKLLGYEPGELEQSIKTWEKLLNPEDREQVMKRLQDHLEGRTSTYEGEYRVRSKSGEWVWFHTLGRVTSRDEQGRPLRMLGMFNNVTDRKNTEAEAHQRWTEFYPQVYFKTAQAGARVNGGFRDGRQLHRFQVGEFGPGGLYHNTAGVSATAGTTKGITIRFHPNMPIQDHKALWTFDGTLPP